ncbi:hypothetical protein [Parasitella parasitica]|uniref:Uncharacterized protein n=1 Tax=Parasitella parasitica TaxID=35722 RepID=A0A0B7N1L5_9FUNG|nr:hypothetical protein [Parasitella parasitica]
MRGVPIYPPGPKRPDMSPQDAIQQHDILQKIPHALDSSSPEKGSSSHPQFIIQHQQRTRKLPISINTSSSLLHSTATGGKRKLIETPVTPSILSRLSGTLTDTQNNIVSKFGKFRHNIKCENCTNVGCISITTIHHDSNSDEDDDTDEDIPFEFQCTVCHRTQSTTHMNQALGIASKKLKTDGSAPVSISPVPSTSTPIPGTPASMISDEDAASSEKYMQFKSSIRCIECLAIGSLVKFGFTKSSPPRPRFQCNHCKRIFNITNIVDMMDELHASNPTRSHDLTTPEEDIFITDAQPTTTTPEIASQESIDFALLDTPPNSEVLNFLLDSVKRLTEQAAEHQEKFDYINTLLEQNEQLKNELKEQKKENELQKKENESQRKEIENLKNMIKEQKTQKNTTMNNILNTTNIETNQRSTETSGPTAQTVQSNMLIDNTNTSFPALPTATPTYAQQAQKPATPKFKYAPGQFRSHQPTVANLELASKVFNATQQPPTAEYKYLYFPSNKRMKPSLIRSKLTLLGIDNVRILDAHCPDWNVIGLLIHANYESELLSKFTAARVSPIQYNYFDPIHLRDQRHSALSDSEKVTKLQSIFKNNLLRSLSFMRYPTCHSVAKFFHRKDILTTTELTAFLQNKKQQQIAQAFPPNDTTSQQNSTTSVLHTSQESFQSPPAASDSNMQL